MFRILAVLCLAVLVTAGAFLAKPSREFLAAQTLKTRLAPLVDAVPPDAGPVRVIVDADIDWDAATEPLRTTLKDRLAAGQTTVTRPGPTSASANEIRARLDTTATSVTLRYAGAGQPERVVRIAWYAVLPPLLAILAAMILRRVLLCLSLGVAAGGVIAMWPMTANPLVGVWHALRDYLIGTAILGEFKLEIIAFVLLISATVGVAQAAGGVDGILNIVVRFCRTPRAARVGAAIAGVAIFFDDYLNCIIVGNTMRPLTDRFHVSRAKLAYIVDSTAAPIAGLALVSTWIAFEVSQIEIGLHEAGSPINAYDMFVRTLPYRFYCAFTLILVFLVCWTGRDFGPMVAAEHLAAAGSADLGAAAGPAMLQTNAPPRARNAVIPIGITLLCIAVGLWWTAQPEMRKLDPPPNAAAYVRAVLQHANSTRAFFVAGAIGYLAAVLLPAAQRALTLRQTIAATRVAVRNIRIAVVLLFLAWSMGAACKDVGTAVYLVAMFREVLNPVVFAVIVFGLASLVSFSTGTSYGTMAILLPNVVPLAFAVGAHAGLGGVALATISIGAVLEGAIFGDHCSPLSDTTILSALASNCTLIDHVRTQLPYALTSMLVAWTIGYIPAALGVPAYVSLAAGAILLALIVRYAGR